MNIRTLLAILTLALPLLANAGPIPFTQNQFPVWWTTANAPVSVTNVAEQAVFISAVPPNIMGNAGVMRITVIAGGDGGSTNHTIKGYLGGPGITNATALWTNNFLSSKSTPITTTIFPFVGGYSNLVYSTVYTNFNAGALKQTIVVGSQTNGLYLTISAGMDDTHGTYTTVGGVIVEALGQ